MLLTGITLFGGLLPFMVKKISQTFVSMLLAFSGSFLFGVTAIHLLPESFQELGEQTGVLVLIGFFIQLLLQRVSHGVEHGHIHTESSHHHDLFPVFIGLSVHAFMEGIPLGFNYQDSATLPSIFLGVAAHKIPEAITLSSLLLINGNKTKKIHYVVLFALVSPIAGLLAMYYGQKFYFISSILIYIIPIVIGSFLHISTTILYESGTKHHELSKQKVVAVILGIGLALSTLFFHHH